MVSSRDTYLNHSFNKHFSLLFLFFTILKNADTTYSLFLLDCFTAGGLSGQIIAKKRESYSYPFHNIPGVFFDRMTFQGHPGDLI